MTTHLRDGVEIRVVSYADLIHLKRAAGRDLDLLDIEALREIREEG